MLSGTRRDCEGNSRRRLAGEIGLEPDWRMTTIKNGYQSLTVMSGLCDPCCDSEITGRNMFLFCSFEQGKSRIRFAMQNVTGFFEAGLRNDSRKSLRVQDSDTCYKILEFFVL
jgi:hypothetical protein